MTETTVPDFFWKFPMQRVRTSDLDAALADASTPLTILFLWGHDCPNRDIAKREILASIERFQWPQVRWLHGNVYEQPELATRFGLHGIPAFFVFRGTRKLGRLTPWPGLEAFVGAIETQIAALVVARVDEPQ